jgi:hypothetical protein
VGSDVRCLFAHSGEVSYGGLMQDRQTLCVDERQEACINVVLSWRPNPSEVGPYVPIKAIKDGRAEQVCAEFASDDGRYLCVD